MIRSLRLRLMVLATVSAFVGWGMAGVLAYFEAMHQVHKIFDAQLSLVGGLLSTRTRHELAEVDLPALVDDNLLGGEEPGPLAFQVWWGAGVLMQRSANAPEEALAAEGEGHQDREVGGQIWRVVAKRDPHGEFEVHVGAPHDALETMAQRHFWEEIAPVTLSVPVTLLLLAIGVQLGLAPLVRLAREVASRDHQRLDPIDVGHVPTEAKPLVDELNELFARLDEAFEREARFASDCAHEVRAPLAGARTQVQLAMRTADEEARRRALGQALVAVDRGTHLAEQLLALARCEPEAAPLRLAPIDLRQVVRPVLEDLAPLSLARGIELELLPEDCPTVLGNAEALMAMTRNLVDNALRYCPPGSRVSVRTGTEGEQACLTVEDDGPGIPSEERERVFERFYRGPTARAGGSGLGLAIVRNVAENHRASLSVDTPPSGQGLRVRVCLSSLEHASGAIPSQAAPAA